MMQTQADIQINNDVAITIFKFETLLRRSPTGELEDVDMIHYAPKGDAKSLIIREVKKMKKVLPIEECGDNLAYIRANRLWFVIQPNYEHWKTNNALPEDGTPLAAWAGVTQAQAQVLRNAGLRTVEDVAEASDIVLSKTGLANVVVLRDQAQRYLKTEDTAKASAQMTTLEAENKELREQMAEMMALMKEMQAEKAAERDTGKKAKAEKAAA